MWYSIHYCIVNDTTFINVVLHTISDGTVYYLIWYWLLLYVVHDTVLYSMILYGTVYYYMWYCILSYVVLYNTVCGTHSCNISCMCQVYGVKYITLCSITHHAIWYCILYTLVLYTMCVYCSAPYGRQLYTCNPCYIRLYTWFILFFLFAAGTAYHAMWYWIPFNVVTDTM